MCRASNHTIELDISQSQTNVQGKISIATKKKGVYTKRLICATTAFNTGGASRFIHELLKPVLKFIKRPFHSNSQKCDKTNIINHRGMLYLQLVGGVIGSSCFPSIAIISLHIERSLVSSFLNSGCCRLFLRYLDDMFCVFSSEEGAKTFYTSIMLFTATSTLSGRTHAKEELFSLIFVFTKALASRMLTC